MDHPGRCNCTDVLTPEQHERCLADAWQAWLDRQGEPCDDCAFRKGSPEQGEGDLARIATQPVPFRCHKGMPVDARSGKPIENAYAPVLVRGRDGLIEAAQYPICTGWRRARCALIKRP
jgi:hypothetical protein